MRARGLSALRRAAGLDHKDRLGFATVTCNLPGEFDELLPVPDIFEIHHNDIRIRIVFQVLEDLELRNIHLIA